MSEDGERANDRATFSLRSLVCRAFDQIKGSVLARKFVGGMLWLTLGAIPSRAAGLLATALVARILGATVYGELTLARSTVNAFVTVAAFGTGRAAAKLIAEFLVVDKDRVGRLVALNYASSIAASVIVAALFYHFADYLCNVMISAPHLAFQVKLCSPLLVFTALVGAQIGVLTGFQAYREIAISSTVSGFLMIPFYALGAKWYGLTGATLGFTVGSALNFLCNSVFIYRLLSARGVRYHFWGCWREASALWNYCVPSTALSLLTSGATWFVGIELARQPNGSTELGVFDAARQIQTAALYLPVLAANVVVPILSDLNARADDERYARAVRVNVVLNLVFTSVVALACVFLAKPIMRVFGDGFELGAPALIALMGTSVLMSVANVYGSVLTSAGALWSRFFNTILWSGTLICGVYAIERRASGAFGIALAFFVAQIVQTIGLGLKTRQILRRRR